MKTIVHFRLRHSDPNPRTGDPEGLAASIEGLVKSSKVTIEGPRVYVEADEIDATMIRLAVSEYIRSETHTIMVDDVSFKHRTDGPARITRQSDRTIEEFFLWDEKLREDGVEEAVSLGLHEDREAFQKWFSEWAPNNPLY